MDTVLVVVLCIWGKCFLWYSYITQLDIVCICFKNPSFYLLYLLDVFVGIIFYLLHIVPSYSPAASFLSSLYWNIHFVFLSRSLLTIIYIHLYIEHADTGKNLHSHLFRAPLSGNQEVSGFGDGTGTGDTGDNWQVVCDTPKDTNWMRNKVVYFVHADTGLYASVHCCILVF